MDYFLKKQKDIRKKNEKQFPLIDFKRYKRSAIKPNRINYIFVIYVFEKIQGSV